MNDRVKKALEAYNTRSSEADTGYKTKNSKVSDALSAYDERRKNDSEKEISDVYDAYQKAVDSYKSYVSKPVSHGYGETAAKSTVEGQRQNVLDIDHLKDSISKNKEFIGKNAETMLKDLDEMLSGYENIRDYSQSFSAFADENEYKLYQEAVKRNEELLKYDTEKGREEVLGIEDKIREENAKWEEYQKQYKENGGYLPSASFNGEVRNISTEQAKAYKEYLAASSAHGQTVSDLEKQKSDKNSFIRKSETAKLADVAKNPDFKEASEAGANVPVPSAAEAFSAFGIGGEGVTNKVEFLKKNGAAVGFNQDKMNPFGFNGLGEFGTAEWSVKVRYMTDDEIGIYNYYVGKGDNASADRYLKSLDETLSARYGQQIYSGMEDNTILEIAFGVASGLDQFGQGVKNAFNSKDDEIAASPVQYASSLVRENLGENWGGFEIAGNNLPQIAYDAITTTTNMLPSIGISALTNALLPGAGGIVGGALMGTSAAGNAYQEMLNMGYSKDQARVYSTIIGTSETLLQEAIGGIPGLGGVLTDKAISKFAEGVNSAAAKIALTVGGNAYAEGMEEFLQDVLEPYIKSFATGEAPEDIDWGQAVYSGILGSISSVLGSPSDTIRSASEVINTANKFKNDYGDIQNELIAQGLASLEGTDSRKLAEQYKKKADSGKNLNGVQLERLVNANEEAIISEDREKVRDAVENRLSELGETGDVKAIAEALTREAMGESATSEDVAALRDSKFAERVANELDPENIRSEAYSTAWAEKIGTDRVNDVAYNANEYRKEDSIPAKKSFLSKTENKNNNKSEFSPLTVSNDGVSRVAGTDEVIDRKLFTDTENGLAIDIGNGKKVKPEEITYADDEEEYLFDKVRRLGVSASSANAIVEGFNAVKNDIGVENYMLGMEEGIEYGKIGYDLKYARESSFIDAIPESAQKLAYDIGRKEADLSVEREQNQVNNTIAPWGKGTVRFDKSLLDSPSYRNDSEAKKNIMDTVRYGKQIASAFGIDISFFDSKTDKDHANENGWYDPKNGSIHLDINAGREKTVMYTMGHEVTHHIKAWSPQKFKVLSDFIVEEYGKNGVDVENLIIGQMAKDKSLSRSEALEEVVADACESMLLDSNAVEKIAELRAKDKGLFEKIREFIRGILEKLRGTYKELPAYSKESEYAKSIEGMIEKMAALYEDVAVDAYQNLQKAESGLTETDMNSLSEKGLSSVGNVVVSEDLADKMKSEGFSKPIDDSNIYSYKTEPEWEKSVISKYGRTEETERYIDAVKAFTDAMVTDDAVRQFVPMGSYSYNKYGALRTNVEYVFTFDMDTSCPRTFQFLNYRDEIKRKLGRELTYDESVNLLELMRIYKQNIPCSYCYVENKRVLLSASYNNFFKFRNDVMNEVDENEAKKKMYGYSETTGTLSDASQKAFSKWRSDMSFNPSIEEIWRGSNDARDSVLNYLDNALEEGAVKKNGVENIRKKVYDHFKIKGKDAMAEIRNYVAEWVYDENAEKPHKDISGNLSNGTIGDIDSRVLALNHEALAYAKSASSAHAVDNYIPYTDQLHNIENMTKNGIGNVKDYIIGMGGIRKHSSNDFRIDYVQDYMMFFADLAMGGWTGHTYTKSIDYAKIFGRTGDRINLSIAMTDTPDGRVIMNDSEGADWNEVKKLRDWYKDVGAMAMVTSDNQLSFALNEDWIDMVIPFHASSLDPKVWRDMRHWFDYTSKQMERFKNSNEMELELLQKILTDNGVSFSSEAMERELLEAAKKHGAGVPSDEAAKIYSKEIKRLKTLSKDNSITVENLNTEEIANKYNETFGIKILIDKATGKRVKPHFLPGKTVQGGHEIPGHGNNVKEYLRLCKEYGVNPRFNGVAVETKEGRTVNITDHDGYIKVLKETAKTEKQNPIQFNLDEYDDNLGMSPMEYAMKALQDFSSQGGYSSLSEDEMGVSDKFMKYFVGKDIEYMQEYKTDIASDWIDYCNEEQTKADTPNLPGYEDITIGADRVNVSEEVKKSVKSPKTASDFSNRSILANILESSLDSSTPEGQRQIELLYEYKNIIPKIEAMESDLNDLKGKIKGILFTKGYDRIELSKLNDEKIKLQNRIDIYDKKLLRIEAMKPIKNLLESEREKARKKDAAKFREDYKRKKETDFYRPRIEQIVSDLEGRLLHPTSKKSVPDAFASSISKFLSTIDFTTYDTDGNERAGKANENRKAARNALAELSKTIGEESLESMYGQLDISPEMSKWISETAKSFEEALDSDGVFSVSNMTAEQLGTLYKALKSLRTSINNASKMYTSMSSDVSDLATSTMDYLKGYQYSVSENKIAKTAYRTLSWDYAQPATVFDRFGDGGKKIFSSLMIGQAKIAKNTKVLEDFVEDLYTQEEAKKWQSDILTVKIKDNEYRVTPAMLMSFHCLLKQNDSARHMLEGGGIRFADLVDGKKRLTRYEDTFISYQEAYDIDNMLKEKYPRAVEVADAMHKEMNTTGSNWGNEISMKRFGYKAFTIEDYFPIHTIAAKSEYEANQKRANIYALLNKSFTKERLLGAKNTIIVDDIFSVFNDHMSEMALYNAWALPVIDTIKWFNYKVPQDVDSQKNEQSVHNSMRLAYGTFADEYVRRLLESINNSAEMGLSSEIASKNIGIFNKVAVAGNIRVAIQQPFSISRAYELINPKYCKPLVGAKQKTAYDDMIRNSGLALWKSMGYFDVNVSTPFEKKVKKNQTKIDDIYEKSMTLAEKGDNFTWSVLWNACKEEQKELHKDADPQKLLEYTTERFEDIIVRTQVVDSVLTKSQWMRATDFWHKSTSAFMSEPMTSYNALLRSFDKFSRDKKLHGGKKAFAENVKILAKSFGIWALTQTVNALVTAPIDAMRDDDDYESLLEKIVEKFKGNLFENLLPTGMMPYVSDIVEYLIYGNSDRDDMQIFSKFIDFGKQVKSAMDKDTYSYFKLHKLMKSTLELGSSFAGVPVSNVMRDVVAMWNTVAGFIGNGELKFQTADDPKKAGYEAMYNAVNSGNDGKAMKLYAQMMSNSVSPDNVYSGLQALLKKDYLNGEISEEDATKKLLLYSEYTGKGKTNDDIYWDLDKWKHEKETGSSEGYAKYDDFISAVETGKDLKNVIKRYSDNGVSAQTLASQITSEFKQKYIDSNNSGRAALKGKLLNAYTACGYDRDKKSKDIDKWVE